MMIRIGQGSEWNKVSCMQAAGNVIRALLQLLPEKAEVNRTKLE